METKLSKRWFLKRNKYKGLYSYVDDHDYVICHSPAWFNLGHFFHGVGFSYDVRFGRCSGCNKPVPKEIITKARLLGYDVDTALARPKIWLESAW